MAEALAVSLDRFAADQDEEGAAALRDSIERWRATTPRPAFTSWWHEQEFLDRIGLGLYLGWLLANGGVEQPAVLAMLEATTIREPRTHSVPIAVTTGFDDQPVDGGVFSETFELLGFRFSPGTTGFVVSFTDGQVVNRVTLEMILQFGSFYLSQLGTGPVGLRPVWARRTTTSNSDVVSAIIGSPVQLMPLLDTAFIDAAVRRMAAGGPLQSDTVQRLLRIRHRAILEASIESKVVTLWAFLEDLWGIPEDSDRLFRRDELSAIRKALTFLGKQRCDRAVSQLEKLRVRTQNQRIAADMATLKCANGINTETRVRELHSLRSTFAHAGAATPLQIQRAHEAYHLMLSIIDELIVIELAQLGIGWTTDDGNSKSEE